MVQIYKFRLLFNLSRRKLIKISKKLNCESSVVTGYPENKRPVPVDVHMPCDIETMNDTGTEPFTPLGTKKRY